MVRIFKNNLDFFLEEGMRNCNEGNMDKGLEYFNRGLAFDENNINLLFHKSACLFGMGRRKEAKIISKRVIELCDSQEKTEEILSIKSNSYLFLEDSENAIKSFEELLEKYPDNVDALIHMAKQLDSKVQYEDSLKYLDKVLEIDASNYHAILLKCEILMSMEKYDLSKEYLDKAFEMNPDFSYVWYLKGEFESKAFSNYESAIKYYNKALQMDPESSKYLYDAGVCLILLGRNDEAKAYFKRIFDLNPEAYESERYELLDDIFDIIGDNFAVSK